MVAIFESASALLTPEFVESLDPETLASKFLKVEKEYGVKFNKTQQTFNIVGRWEAVRNAHRSLVELAHRDEECLQTCDKIKKEACASEPTKAPTETGTRLQNISPGTGHQNGEASTENGLEDNDTSVDTENLDCETLAETENQDREAPAAVEQKDIGASVGKEAPCGVSSDRQITTTKEAPSGDTTESQIKFIQEASCGDQTDNQVKATLVPTIYKIKGNPKRGRYRGEKSSTGGLPPPVFFLQYHEESYTDQDKVNLDAVIEEYDRGQVNKKVTKEDLRKMLEKNTEQMGRPLHKSLPRGARLPAKKRDLRAFTSEVWMDSSKGLQSPVTSSADVVHGQDGSGITVQFADDHTAFIQATTPSAFLQPTTPTSFEQSTSNSQCSYVQSSPYGQSTYVQSVLNSQSAYVQSSPDSQAAFLQPLTNGQSFLQSQTLGQSLLQPQTIGQSLLQSPAVSQSIVIQPQINCQSFLSLPPVTSQSLLQPSAGSQSFVIQPAVVNQSQLQPSPISQSFVQPQRTSQLLSDIAAENTHMLVASQDRFIGNVNHQYSGLGDISWLSYNNRGYPGASSDTNNQGQVIETGIIGQINETSDTELVSAESANKTGEQTLSTVTPVVQILTGVDNLAIDRSSVKDLVELKPAKPILAGTDSLLLHNSSRPAAIEDKLVTIEPVLYQMAASAAYTENSVKSEFKLDTSVKAVLNSDSSSTGKSVLAGAGLSAELISQPQQTQISCSLTPVSPVESISILARPQSIDPVSTIQSTDLLFSPPKTTLSHTEGLLSVSTTRPSITPVSTVQGASVTMFSPPTTNSSTHTGLLGISSIASSMTPKSYAEGLGLLAISSSIKPASQTEGPGLSSNSSSTAYLSQTGGLGSNSSPMVFRSQTDGLGLSISSPMTYSSETGRLGLPTVSSSPLPVSHSHVNGVSAMLSSMEAVSDVEYTDDVGTPITGEGGNVTVMVSGDSVVVVEQSSGYVAPQQFGTERPDSECPPFAEDSKWTKLSYCPMEDASAIKKEHGAEVAALDIMVPQTEGPQTKMAEMKTTNSVVPMETTKPPAAQTGDVAGSATLQLEKPKQTQCRKRAEKRPAKTKTAQPVIIESVTLDCQTKSTDNTETTQDLLQAKTKKSVKKPRVRKTATKTKTTQKLKPTESVDHETAPSTTPDNQPQNKNKSDAIKTQGSEKPDTMTTQESDAAPHAEHKPKSQPQKKPPIMYKCTECDYKGQRKQRLTEHMGRVHGLLTDNCRGSQERTSFPCDLCDKTFVFGKDLSRHKRIVHHGQVHYCNICNKSYKAKYVFDKHMATHEEGYVQPMFPCKICERQFTTKFSLTCHVKSEHLGLKKTFICPTCGKTFSQIRSYRQHANVHAGIRPYVCEICQKSFTYDKSLKEHRYMHDNIRRFSCPECGKLFRQRTCLLIHQKVHKDTKDHICSSCGKGFTQRQSLVRHERTHSGDRPYKCKLCFKSFNDYGVIRKHMIMSHKKDKADWKSDIAAEARETSDHYIAGGPGYVPREPSTRVREKKMATVIPPASPGGATTIIDHGDNLNKESALVGLVGQTIVNAGHPVVSMYGNISGNVINIQNDQEPHCSSVAIKPQSCSGVPDQSLYQPLLSSLYTNNTYTVAPNTVIHQDQMPNQTIQDFGKSASHNTQIQHVTINGSASPSVPIQSITISGSPLPSAPIQHITIGGSGLESSLNFKPQDLEGSPQAASISVNYDSLQAVQSQSFTDSDPTSITVDDNNIVAAFLKSQGRQTLLGSTDIFASLGSAGSPGGQSLVLEQTRRSQGQGDMTYVLPSGAVTTIAMETAVSNADVTTATSNISWGYPPGYPGYYNSTANYAQYPSSKQN